MQNHAPCRLILLRRVSCHSHMYKNQLYSEKEMGPIILSPLMAHHTNFCIMEGHFMYDIRVFQCYTDLSVLFDYVCRLSMCYLNVFQIYKEVPKMYGQWRCTVPAPSSIKLVSMTICKIVTEMCVVVSSQSYAVRSWPRVRQQCTVKFPLLLSTLVLISVYMLTETFWSILRYTPFCTSYFMLFHLLVIF